MIDIAAGQLEILTALMLITSLAAGSACESRPSFDAVVGLPSALTNQAISTSSLCAIGLEKVEVSSSSARKIVAQPCASADEVDDDNAQQFGIATPPKLDYIDLIYLEKNDPFDPFDTCDDNIHIYIYIYMMLKTSLLINYPRLLMLARHSLKRTRLPMVL